MKKTFKLLLVMALVVVMALSVVACGGNEEPVESADQVPCNWTGLPIFDTMQTITLVTEDGNSTLEDIQDAYNFKYYKEKAKMDIRVTNGRPMATKIVMLMATNTLPDFIWRTRLNYTNFIKYCFEGNYFLDFNPYIEAGKMPGLELFDEFHAGTYLDSCRSANTQELNGFLRTNLQGPAGGTIPPENCWEWNMAWLDAADAEIPFTRDELFTTLYALKDAYGASSESLVIAAAKADLSQGIHMYLAKGLGLGSATGFSIVANAEGKFIPWYEDATALENVRNLMKDFYTLYADGLIDPWFETRTNGELDTLALQNKLGFSASLNGVNNLEKFDTFKQNGGTWTARVAHTLAKKTTDKTSYVIDGNPVDTGGVWGCINRNTKYADGLVRFFEWHFDDFTKHGQPGKGDLEVNSYDRELTLLTNMYVIGYNCLYTEEGGYDFSSFMDPSYNGDVYTFQRSQFIPELMLFGHAYSGGWYERMEGEEADTKWTWERCVNFNLYETAEEKNDYSNMADTGAVKLAKTRGIERQAPVVLKMNSAQTTANKTVIADYTNFVKMWVGQFANGTKNPNDEATWNQFLSDLKLVDLEPYCNMQYDLYKQNNKEIVPYADLFS